MKRPTWISFTRPFTLFFSKISGAFKAIKQWIAPSNEDDFPPDESGELMRRYMGRATWFDRVSMGWFKQSFLKKTAYVIGLTLISGLIGLIFGATWIAFPIGLVSLVVHKLLSSHTQGRYVASKLFAKETIELNASLKETNAFFQATTNQLITVTQGIKAQGEALTTPLQALTAGHENITQLNFTLLGIVDKVDIATKRLIEEEEGATTVLQSVTSDLKQCDESIIQSTAQVISLDNSALQLMATAQITQDNNQSFSLAVDSFNRFISQTTSQIINNSVKAGTNADQYLKELRAERDAEEISMERLRQQMEARGIYQHDI